MILPLAAALLVPTTARAQNIFDGDRYRSADDPLRDDRLVGVKERLHPGLESKGIEVDGLNIRPSLSASTAFISNLLAVENGDDDVLLSMRPEIGLQLPHSQFDISLAAWLAVHRHQDRELENSEEYGVSAKAKIPLSNSYAVFVTTEAGRFTEARNAISARRDSLNPVQFDQARGALQFQKTSGRLLIGTELFAERLAYKLEENRPQTSAYRLIDNRSRDEFRLSAISEYALSPDTAIWGLFRANQRSGLRNSSRNSRGFDIAGGMRFKPTPLVELSAALGYLEYNFQAPLRNVKGATVDARLKWLPTMLTTVRANFSRKIEDRGLQSQRDFFVSEFGLTIDHELRRNFILDVSLGFINFDLYEAGSNNRRRSLALGAQYQPSRYWTIKAKYHHIRQNSSEALRQFSQSRFSFSLLVTA